MPVLPPGHDVDGASSAWALRIFSWSWRLARITPLAADRASAPLNWRCHVSRPKIATMAPITAARVRKASSTYGAHASGGGNAVSGRSGAGGHEMASGGGPPLHTALISGTCG